MSWWKTQRTSALSIPIPKAIVATMTSMPSPLMNACWRSSRTLLLSPPW
jgi:hypothetical protein